MAVAQEKRLFKRFKEEINEKCTKERLSNMTNYEKLIIRAHPCYTGIKRQVLDSALVEYDKSIKKYTAKGFVKGGHKMAMWSIKADTVQKAVELLHELAKKYPPEHSFLIAMDWESHAEWGKIYGKKKAENINT